MLVTMGSHQTVVLRDGLSAMIIKKRSVTRSASSASVVSRGADHQSVRQFMTLWKSV